MKEELLQIEKATVGASADDVVFYPHLAVGRRVAVTGGPQAGLSGIVLDHVPEQVKAAAADEPAEGRMLVVLQVTVLGQGAAVYVPPSLLAEADEPSATSKSTPRKKFELVEPTPRRTIRRGNGNGQP